MKRKFYNYLLNWKKSNDRKPLLVKGARQIGKTYIISEFAKNEYENFVYCNLEVEDQIRRIFENTLEPTNIIQNIQNIKKQHIFPEKTLLFLDEIQCCPQALTSLKYFNESANQYHVVASGSLLGVALNRGNYSYPVGKVTSVILHPMDFEEFVWAVNLEFGESLTKQIHEAYLTSKPFSLHETALDLYKLYLYIGGMPSAINKYMETKDFSMVRETQKQIIDAYMSDMSKYNKQTEIPKTRLVFQNIGTQLSKPNKKFKYSLIKHGAKSRDFEQSIEWICLTGMASKLYRIEQIKLPMNSYKSLTDFKFYLNDIGLCGAFENISFDDIKFDEPKFSDFKGGLVENYVFNQLSLKGFELYYWTSKSDAEIDFVTRICQDIIPIEVKSNEHVRSRSLNSYISQFHPKYSIRISSKNFGFENNIKSIPLYAIFCLEK